MARQKLSGFVSGSPTFSSISANKGSLIPKKIFAQSFGSAMLC